MKNIHSNKHLWHLDELTEILLSHPAQVVNRSCEAYSNCIDQTAEMIANDPNHKIIMLSGPSGSGKTTTANMLRKSLLKLGVDSYVVSLDDFYLGLGKAPLLPDGNYDYETVHALNLPLLQECLMNLVMKNSCLLPRFNFEEGKPFDERVPVECKPGDLMIFEGIHAMNPLILDCLPKESIIKLYVSVETTVFGHKDFLIPPREIRLARRIVRDHLHRNADAARTLAMWTGVMHGEDHYLFPYKDQADHSISTFHEFEPAVLRPFLLPLLENLTEDCPNYELAMDLAVDYSLFPVLDKGILPDHCLIREFIE